MNFDTIDYEFSYFQIDTYERCPRKWGWLNLDGVVGEKAKSAVLGIDVHEILAHWLKDRKFLWDRPGSKIAEAIAPLLPPPQAVNREHVEMPIGFTLSDVKFIGDVDLFVPAGVVGPYPRVYDHKSTRDLKWMLTAEAMPDDVQATLYGGWALLKTGAPVVEVQWTYGKTEGAPKADSVRTQFTGAIIRPRLERSIQSAREMRMIRQAGLTSLQLPFDAGECEAFGGCPYRNLCNLTPEERMESVMSQGTAKDEFLARLQSRKNGAAVEQPVNPPVAAAVAPVVPAAIAPAAHPVAVAVPAQPTQGGVLARLKARQAAASAGPVQVVVETPVVTPMVLAPPTVVTAAPPVQVELPPVVAESKQRGPGRPKKDAIDERWALFASSTIGAIVTATAPDLQAPDELAELASGIADAMLKQYLDRFSS